MKFPQRIARLVAIAALLALLSACGRGMDGTFEDELGLSSITFKRDGTAVQSVEMAGAEVQLQYRVDGDKVRLTNPASAGMSVVLTRVDADTLSGPMGIKYRRKK